MSRPSQRPRWLTPVAADALIVGVLLLELELEAQLDTVVPAAHRLAASLLVVLLVLPVTGRRRWPAGSLLTYGAVAGALQTPPADNLIGAMTGPILPLILLAFTAGRRLDARRGFLAAVGAGLLIAAGGVWSAAGPSTGQSVGGDVVSALVLPTAAWALGWLWDERGRRELAFRELVARIEAERELREQDSVIRERLRISRELQDIIAQNISAIIIQAGGARQWIGSDPEGATSAILSVESAGREALADLRRTLGLLRNGDDPRRLAPQPGLRQLDALIAAAREHEVDCEVRTEGLPRPLATGVDLVAYRVIEATLRADPQRRPTAVLLGYGADHLDVEIPGRGPDTGLAEQLQELAERVALYDGSLSVTSEQATQWIVRARLPTKVAAP